MPSFFLSLALCASAASGRAVSPSAAGAGGVRAEVRAYRSGHEVEILREFAQLLAIPNVASDRADIERNAETIAAALERRGVRTELLRVAGAPPAVYGEIQTPGAKRTVILYAHYDGQPVKPSEWTGNPWKPVLRDRLPREGGREIPFTTLRAPLDPEWRLFARSAADDKAPIAGVLAALDALRACRRPLSVNLKLFFEGEEEAGSPHLAALLSNHAERMKGDLWLLLDGPVHQTRRIQLYFGARGVTDLEITVYGPARRVHSGHYGNWAPNPILELARLLASMRDEEGRILVPGFLDDVRPVTETERRALAEAPPVEDTLRRELALGRTEGRGEPLALRLMLPALNLRGIAGGDVGPQATNSIPTEATASIDFRLVPGQTPERVRERIEEHVRRQGFTVVREIPSPEVLLASPKVARLTWGPGYPAARTAMDLPVSRAVIRAVEEAAGGPVVKLPTLGGSIPMYLFEDFLRTPAVGVPIVNHDDNQHAADENLRLQNLWDGIELYATLMARLGPLWAEESGR